MSRKPPSDLQIRLLGLLGRQLSGRDVSNRYWVEFGHDLSDGTLYTTLRRLEDKGWVRRRDDPDGDARARLYKITSAGLEALEAARDSHTELAQLAEKAMQQAEKTVQQSLLGFKAVADSFVQLLERSISPFLEMGAYETLWTSTSKRLGFENATFKRLADLFSKHSGLLPSDFVDKAEATENARRVMDLAVERGVKRFNVRINRALDYPQRLRDAKYPVELLYYCGSWELTETPAVAVVGSRNPTDDGRKRTRRLVGMLVERGWTVVSGLAAGVDTEAHTTAIQRCGKTIGVIGTPLSDVYPRENKELQEQLAREYLVISQVPFLRYSQQDWRFNRAFFPERNVTMSALTDATIIVEASDTSGTLRQAKAALEQRRKLFILDSCFKNPKWEWPRKFEKAGAIRVRDFEQIMEALCSRDEAPSD